MLFNKLYPSPTEWRDGGGMAMEHLHIGDVVQFHGSSPHSVFLICSFKSVWQFPLELLAGEEGCADLLAVHLRAARTGSEVKAQWQKAAFHRTPVTRRLRVTRLFGNIFNLSKEKESSNADPIFEGLAGNVPSPPVEHPDYAIFDDYPADVRTVPPPQPPPRDAREQWLRSAAFLRQSSPERIRLNPEMFSNFQRRPD